MARPWIFGVDFDNTLVVYDELFRTIAAERGLISAGAGGGKRQIRDAIRMLPGGEIQWQKLQAVAYGPRIGEARLAEGAGTFLGLCRRAGVKVYVISHKTERAGYDETGTNLRNAAMRLMEVHQLFGAEGFGLEEDAIYFGATRREKIGYIRSLGCTHFIDDLEETFLEDSFPAGVQKILYAPKPPADAPSGVIVAVSWKHICDYLFDEFS
jgi:hypothetical protein